MLHGGEEEQEAECDTGNPDVKIWQDKAKKIVENEVSFFFLKSFELLLVYLLPLMVLDGKILEE